MDDNELIRRVRNSFRAKKSRAQILKSFQKKGYKLEYAEKLISKALLPKRIIGMFILSLIIFFSGSIASYTLFSNKEKIELENPLDRLSLSENFAGTELEDLSGIKITTEFVSYLLNEVGAWQLHAHPITFEKPVITTQLDENYFSSIIGDEIETVIGSRKDADVQIALSDEILIEILSLEDPEMVVRSYLENGEILVTPLAHETTLLAKGYLKLYEGLK